MADSEDSNHQHFEPKRHVFTLDLLTPVPDPFVRYDRVVWSLVSSGSSNLIFQGRIHHMINAAEAVRKPDLNPVTGDSHEKTWI
jgi:hypothetical protein